MSKNALIRTANFAGLLSLTVLAAPFDRAYSDVLGLGTLPVEVTNQVQTTVINPPDFPVQTTNIDEPGRITYTDSRAAICDGVSFCQVTFRQVPDGYLLVIRNITGYFGISGNPAFVAVQLQWDATDNYVSFFAPFAGGLCFFDHPTLFYISARSDIRLSVNTSGNNISHIQSGHFNDATTANFTLIGYLLDCNVGQCSFPR
jgi:hypothetical protein